VFRLPRDPKDEPFIDVAVAGGANYIVTWNSRHLTYLMKRDTAEGKDFCSRFPAIQIVDPPTFINAIDAAHAP
jgi:predicted nucleic acid-binding protein